MIFYDQITWLASWSTYLLVSSFSHTPTWMIIDAHLKESTIDCVMFSCFHVCEVQKIHAMYD